MGKTSVAEKVTAYIETHLERELSLGEIAGELHYSKYYMAREFRKSTGITLHKYIQGRRLEEAARKLAQTEQPILEIAFDAGYGSQQAFTQAFRVEYLCTPQEYRRRGQYISKRGAVGTRKADSYMCLYCSVRGGMAA